MKVFVIRCTTQHKQPNPPYYMDSGVVLTFDINAAHKKCQHLQDVFASPSLTYGRVIYQVEEQS